MIIVYNSQKFNKNSFDYKKLWGRISMKIILAAINKRYIIVILLKYFITYVLIKALR